MSPRAATSASTDKESAPRNVPIASVRIPDGRRKLRGVEDLAASIAEIGLLNPITVTPDLRLVAGYHRLEACRSLGWQTIPAVIVALQGLRAELAEIDENLVRSELTELERGQNLLRRKQIYQSLYPETRHITLRGGPGRGHKKTDDTLSPVSFSAATARKMRASPRTIQRAVRIAERIDPEAAEQIKDHPIANQQQALLKLVELEPRLQREVARKLDGESTQQLHKLIRDTRWENASREVKEAPKSAKHYVVHHGDFAAAAKRQVSDRSVDLVVADPLWDASFAARLAELGEVTARVLTVGGTALVIVSQERLPEMLQAMLASGLSYRWTLCYLLHHPAQLRWPTVAVSEWYPVLVFSKPGLAEWPHNRHGDIVRERSKPEGPHPYAKDVAAIGDLIEWYSEPGELVLDPCCGGGSTGVAALERGRRFVGIDIDAGAVRATAASLKRVHWGCRLSGEGE